MSAVEYPKEYTPTIFPYAKIFEQLTRELQTTPLDPITTYARFLKLRREAGLLSGADYCSTAITTGGHVHVPGLALQEVINRNTRSARLLAAELVSKDILHPHTMILPVDMGYVPGWGQSDWISFWLAVISGVDLGMRADGLKLQKFRSKLENQLEEDCVNLALLNDHESSAAVRAPEYFKFARAWSNLTAMHRPEPHSAHRLVSLIDTKDSLGSQTERLFARLRGIPMYNVGVIGGKSAFHSQALYRDLEMIVAYGGTTVEFIEGSTFVLKAPTTTPELSGTQAQA